MADRLYWNCPFCSHWRTPASHSNCPLIVLGYVIVLMKFPEEAISAYWDIGSCWTAFASGSIGVIAENLSYDSRRECHQGQCLRLQGGHICSGWILRCSDRSVSAKSFCWSVVCAHWWLRPWLGPGFWNAVHPIFSQPPCEPVMSQNNTFLVGSTSSHRTESQNCSPSARKSSAAVKRHAWPRRSSTGWSQAAAGPRKCRVCSYGQSSIFLTLLFYKLIDFNSNLW